MKLFSILCAVSLLFSSFLLHLKYKKKSDGVSKGNNNREKYTHALSNNTLQFFISFFFFFFFRVTTAYSHFSSFFSVHHALLLLLFGWLDRPFVAHALLYCCKCVCRMDAVSCVDEHSNTYTQTYSICQWFSEIHVYKRIKFKSTRIRQCACAIQAVSIK